MAAAALIAEIRDHRVAEIYLHVDRVVVRVLGGHVAGQGAQVCATRGGKAGGVKRGDGVRVCRVTEDVGWAAGDRIDDVRVNLRRPLAGAWKRAGSGWVAIIGVGGCDLL